MDKQHWFHVWWNVKMMELEDRIQRFWWKIWNAHILLWWYRLWIRRDEFHPSLSIDLKAMDSMTPEERENYRQDLARRRQIAHRQDELKEDDDIKEIIETAERIRRKYDEK